MAKPNPWDSYTHYMLLKKQISATEYIDNINEHAFLGDLKGSIVSMSPNFKFQEYDLELPDDNGKLQKIHFNELKAFYDAITKNFVGSAYGIRLNNEKYALSKYDADKKIGYFSKKDGGASIALTNSMVIFASYNTKLQGGDKIHQNVGQCNLAVEKLAMLLKASKY